MSTSHQHTQRSSLRLFCVALFAGVAAILTPQSSSQILKDGQSNVTGSAATFTWSHTVSSDDKTILLVGLSKRRANRIVNSVTYGGLALTRIGFQNSAANTSRTELWYVLSPPVGTANLAVTLSGSTDVVAGAVSFSGVDQTAPLGTFASASGTGTTASLPVSSAVGEVIVDVASALGTALSLTPGYGQSENWNTGTGDAGMNVHGGSSSTPGASSILLSWTLGASVDWAVGAIALKPANAPNVVLTLVQDQSAPPPGATVVYTINYTNSGTGPAGNTLIAFSPPANTTLVANSITLNGTPKTDAGGDDEVTLTGSTITVNLGPLPSGSGGTLSYQVIIQ